MAEEILGHGKIIVEVEENVARELKKAEEQFDRTMARLDRKEAELKLAIDAKQFEAQYRKIDAQLREWDKKRATATATIDTRKAQEQIDKLQAKRARMAVQEERLNNQLIKLGEDRVAAEQKFSDAIETGDRKLAAARKKQAEETAKAIQKAEEDALRAHQKAAEAKRRSGEKARAAEIRAEEERVRASVAASRAEAAAREAQAKRTVAAIKRAEEEATKAAAAESRKRAAEAAAARAAEERAEKAKWKRITKDRLQAERDAARVQRQHEADNANAGGLVRQYMETQRRIDKLRNARGRLFNTVHENYVIDLDIEGFERQAAQIKARLQAIGKPPPEVHFNVDESGASKLSRWTKALTDTTVRLGPFTTSIGGAVRALALLGPIITGLVGALGALTGAIGVGFAGAIGVAGAGIAGFVPLLGGMIFAIKPIVSEMLAASKAQKAYNDAVDKYGKNSDQAKTKLKQLHNVTASLPASTRRAIKGWEGLKKSFTDATDEVTRRNFGKVFEQSVKTGQKLMPMFGAQVNRFTSGLAKGLTGWMKGLRSAEGQDILGRLMGNANRALGPLLHGLGQLGAAAGRAFAAFSDHLPGLLKGFDRWAQGFSNATKNTNKVNSTVDTLVRGMRSVGHFAMSATRLLSRMFMVAAGPGGGINFLDRISNGLDGINRNIAENPDGLAGFFRDSVNTTEQLYQALKPLLALFMEWSTIMRPFTDQMLKVMAFFGKITNSLAQFQGTRLLLQGAFGIFLLGTLASKVLSARAAIIALGASMKAVGAQAAAQRGLSTFGNAMTGGFVNNLKAQRAATAAPAPLMRPGVAVAPGLATNAGKAAGEVTRLGKAGAAARVGLAGLGAATLGIGTAAAGATVGIAALGAGLLIYANRTRDWQKSQQAAADAAKSVGDITRSIIPGQMGLAQAYLDTKRAASDVKTAEQNVRAMRKAGKTGTDEYKQAIMDLRQAQLNEAATKQQAIDLNNQQRASYQRLADEASRAVQKSRQTVDELGKYRGTKDIYDDLATSAKRAGMSIEDYWEKYQKGRTVSSDTKKNIDAYIAALKEQGAAEREAKRVSDLLALSSLNQQRALRGLVPLTERQGKAMIALQKQAGGGQIAQKIAVKFEDPGSAAKVARSASRSLRSGVPSKVVTRIIADSKSADAAIKRLNKARITPKRLQIIENGGQKAIRVLQGIAGRKLTPKEQKIVERGGAAALRVMARILGVRLPKKDQQIGEKGSGQVLSVLARILGIRLPNKSFTIRANDAATGTLRGVANWLSGLHDKTITVRAQHIGGLPTNATGGMFASGGYTGDPAGGGRGYRPSDRELARVMQSAQSRSVQRATGQIVRRPTIMVGEQNKAEYVIATNPAYRQRNEKLLSSAATQFGKVLVDRRAVGLRDVRGVSMSSSGRQAGMAFAATGSGSHFTGGGSYFAGTNAPPNYSGKKYKPGIKFTSKKKRQRAVRSPKKKDWGRLNRVFKVDNPWMPRLRGLLTRQEDLEREASIRERLVQEPEDFIKASGKKLPNGEDEYIVDDDAVGAYQDSVKQVMEAYKTLKQITAEIVQMRKKVTSAVAQEVSQRTSNVKILKGEITRQESRAKSKDKSIAAAAKAKLKKLKPEFDFQKDKLSDAKGSKKELPSVWKEAGFDHREFQIDWDTWNKEYNDVSGTATQQAADKNDAGGSGGGGGGGDTGPTMQQQAAMADTERANVLKDFGGNMYAMNGGAAGGAGASGGTQANIAGVNLNDPASGGAYSGGNLGVPSSSYGGTSGVMAALAGGASASQALTQPQSAPLGGGDVTAAGGNKTVNITNNYATVPPDPMTYSQGMAFEIANAV